MEVQIFTTKFITPSSPTPQNLQRLYTSCLDEFLPQNNVTGIFYYPSSSCVNISADRISRQLQKSLSETLTLFYPLAGRYIRDDLLIDCNDKGAEYVEARASGRLAQLLEGELQTPLRNQLVHQPCDYDDLTPLVKVQFNTFECGGLAIGVCVQHRIADGFTAFTFINAWATACRVGIDSVPGPSFQLASLCPAKDTPAIQNRPPQRRAVSKKIVTKRFVFDGAAISNLKAICASGLKVLKHQPTRVEVVTGLLWRTLIKVLAQARNGRLRPSLLTLPINLRGRTGLPISEHSFGNFFRLSIAKFTPEDESNVELHELVSQVHTAIRSAVADCAKVSGNADDLFAMAISSYKELAQSLRQSEADVFVFSSWCRFPMYETDFGWGKPVWVSSVHVPKEIVLLMDGKDGDGIEAWVGLEENSMLIFEQNPDIIAFTCQK